MLVNDLLNEMTGEAIEGEAVDTTIGIEIDEGTDPGLDLVPETDIQVDIPGETIEAGPDPGLEIDDETDTKITKSENKSFKQNQIKYNKKHNSNNLIISPRKS